jgi:hypothetical protein
MSVFCENLTLPNLGKQCPVVMGEIKRVIWTSRYKEDGTANYITKSNAALLSNWQTLFDKQNYDSDVLEKVVPSGIIYESASEQGDPNYFDNAGYRKKTRDGDYNINFMFNEATPYYIKQAKQLEDNNLAFYLLDNNNKVWGKESGDNLYPIPVVSVTVPNFNLPSFDSISQEMISMRVEDPEDMNQLFGVTVASSSWQSPVDWYSLVNIDGATTSPAVTGAAIAFTYQSNGNAIAAELLTFDDFTLVDQADDSETTLSSADSITESPNGTYTIDEAALLTSGHTYTVKVSLSGYDFFIDDIVVP